MRLDYWNLDGQIDFEDLPFCPFCGQPMQRGEELKIIAAHSRRYFEAARRHTKKRKFYLRWRKVTQQHMANLRRCDRVPFPAAYC